MPVKNKILNADNGRAQYVNDVYEKIVANEYTLVGATVTALQTSTPNLIDREIVEIVNLSGGNVYIGTQKNITTSLNALTIANNGSLSLNVGNSVKLYALSSGGGKINVFEKK